MALLFKRHLSSEAELAVWRIEEGEDFFRSKLTLMDSEQEELEQIKGRRRLEWLASRYLVQLMMIDLGLSELESHIAMHKDEYGKPHLTDSSWHISFSHSHEMATAIISRKSCGIDIQHFVPKIEMITRRFMRKIECQSLKPESRLQHLHLYWGAKESLYKSYGRKELDFKNQIRVIPFEYSEPKGSLAGEVSKDDFHWSYDLHYEVMGKYFLVWAEQVAQLT